MQDESKSRDCFSFQSYYSCSKAWYLIKLYFHYWDEGVTPWWCCQNIVCNFYHNTLLASIGKTFWTPRFVLWVSKGLIKRHFFHSAFHLIFDESMCHNYKTGNPLKHLTSAIELSRLVLPNKHTSYHKANGSAQAWVRLKCLKKSLCQSLILSAYVLSHSIYVLYSSGKITFVQWDSNFCKSHSV